MLRNRQHRIMRGTLLDVTWKKMGLHAARGLLMAITMIGQTFLNPPPADPLQAKMMKIMPLAFSVMFFFFPAGLVLYWLVNNILSIAQQWWVNKQIEKDAAKAKSS